MKDQRLVLAAAALGAAPFILTVGRALGRTPLENGDYQFSPTRRGGVYRNDLSIAPAEIFRWLPAAEANLLAYDARTDSYPCASALRVDSPDGTTRDLPLRPNPACSMILPVTAEVSLLSSAAGAPARGRDDAPSAGGLALIGAAVAAEPDRTRVTLEWRVDAAPRAVLAFIPRLRDADGTLLLDSVFSSRGVKRPYRMIWPLVDDVAPGLDVKPGRTLRQTFVLRRAVKGLAHGAYLELDAFEIAPSGGAVALGTVSAPVSLER